MKELFLTVWNNGFRYGHTPQVKSTYLLENFEEILNEYDDYNKEILNIIKNDKNNIFKTVFTNWTNIKRYYIYDGLYSYKIIDRLVIKENNKFDVIFETTSQNQVNNTFKKLINHLKSSKEVSSFKFPEPISETKTVLLICKENHFITHSLKGLAKSTRKLVEEYIGTISKEEKPTLDIKYLNEEFVDSLPNDLKIVAKEKVNKYKEQIQYYNEVLKIFNSVNNLNNDIYTLSSLQSLLQFIDNYYSLDHPEIYT